MSRNRSRLTAAATALALTALTLTTSIAPASAAANRPDIKPLPENLESIRAAEAQKLYGSPDIKPVEERKSSLITMGDSEISGEGVGNYDPNTHRDGNWCDRSYDQAIFRTGIASDVQYNVACSGGASPHLIQGSGETQWDELNQGDNLAIKARNTKIKLVWIAIGANDSGGIEFGPVATECATNRILFKGPCYPNHTDNWAARVEVSEDGVEKSIDAIRKTMTEAGYLDSDYEFVVMSYPSPGGPDVEDNPNFPGWYKGGCLLYLADAAFARNKAVPLFEDGIRDAATAKGVRYLNAGKLFEGHGVCEDNTWARGVYVEVGELPSEHAFRQSLHPNARGHGAFAQCITQFFDNPDWQNATCVDPASTGNATLYNGLFEFKDVKNSDSGLCVDAKGYDSRDGTPLQAYGCHGGRNQGYYYDQSLGSLHVELSHDRCVDFGNGAVGAKLTLRNCDGGTDQKFVIDDQGVHPKGDTSRCAAFASGGSGANLVIANCGGSGSKLKLSTRDYANPVGYGHDDFIGSRVY
ncbi:ricin-type beta-trefoil lectin domain protein [Stackebrandtia nassauensis]|uniref:Ricin B lectin n=1 Tax=Stackebrandtia nassauensis (strain DSM 44728 / CIP 108903 / NRRL B-16338 / NBRC 102104 / LLR-40K-21) TaxID=446470 RepID=D3Q1A7_STANL|nr:ricin-type beta-trefoil lectin domain protein [Stackebrandtia nassauensis]ADD45687.1 Ricin B lectin [Stackebrandtia nassauensis DSM 44728]